MLDYRIYTFITLCDQMNYHQTALVLNMSQPAVSQHIRYLENELNCKLFEYENKKLTMTSHGKALEQHVRSLVYNDKKFMASFNSPKVKKHKVGATKSIGDYLMKDDIIRLNQQEHLEISLIIDNTTNLLNALKNGHIDFALIEGYFDKQRYDHQLYKIDKLVGVVSKRHRFANKHVTIEEIFDEKLILREEGSGTRDIFIQVLRQNNFSVERFKSVLTMSSPEMIKSLIKQDIGISFMYSCVVKGDDLSTFEIIGSKMEHEFNFVYLKNTMAKEAIIDFIG